MDGVGLTCTHWCSGPILYPNLFLRSRGDSLLTEAAASICHFLMISPKRTAKEFF